MATIANKQHAMQVLPTSEVYAELQQAFDFFNLSLFDGKLSPCIITLQREHCTYGYFSKHRFVKKNGKKVHEIAMNPAYFPVRTVRETLSTLSHELAHQWQAEFGEPGRRGYHNKQWANKMEKIGLMPSDTGLPGGRKVGDQMTHYIIPGGKFDKACDELITAKFQLSWMDRFPAPMPTTSMLYGFGSGRWDLSALLEDELDDPVELLSTKLGTELTKINIEDPLGLKKILKAAGAEWSINSTLIEPRPQENENRSNRIKYRCPSCQAQAWGKPGLKLLCGEFDCEEVSFEVVR